MTTRDVLLIEPYYGGSHRAWADSYQRHSRHHVELLTLPAQFWKWRMQGGAVTLARRFQERGFQPDVILASSMFDLSTFRALTRDSTHHVPIGLYFHENQLTYPQNSRQKHGWRYGFINYISALAADSIFFNSAFHRGVFFEELPRMLKHFGDFNELQTVAALQEKSSVLPLGLDLARFDRFQNEKRPADGPPLIIWNHRWDEDKNPATFFAALDELHAEDIPFRVALLGENVRRAPDEFERARDILGDRVVRYGYIEDFPAYASLLWEGQIIVSTAYQDFFGASTAEAIYCGCVPVLPDRLNYPYLIPDAVRGPCLFPDDHLASLLRRHLTGEITVDRTTLQGHIAQYDWSRIAPQYDAALDQLADRPSNA